MVRLALATLLALAPLVADAATFTLSTSDGVTLHATDYGPAKGTMGVVLIHDKGRSQSDWANLAPKLGEAGFHVVTVDLRGHGTSTTSGELTDADYPKMVADVKAAVAWLKSKGCTKISLVGANFGANLAINEAADDPLVTNLIMLSPGLNLGGLTTGASMDRYTPRPVLLVASNEDAYAIKTVNFLDPKITGAKKVEIYEGAGSGVKMLSKAPTLEALIVSWLNESAFAKQAQRDASANPSAPVTGDIETTGQKFGDTTTSPPTDKKPVDLDDP